MQEPDSTNFYLAPRVLKQLASKVRMLKQLARKVSLARFSERETAGFVDIVCAYKCSVLLGECGVNKQLDLCINRDGK